jgi:PKHD-type hydroxylase
MYLQIARTLDPDLVSLFQRRLAAGAWDNGTATAGYLSARVKANSQLSEQDGLAQELGALVRRQLEASPQFMSAALPLRVGHPLFNRYRVGEQYGRHIDGAVRSMEGSAARLRTDLSATLFLSDPESYDGGELAIEDAAGHETLFKLAAGDLLLYPAATVHRVVPLRRGVRFACFFWVQSMVRSEVRRDMLYSLDLAIQRLAAELPEHPSIVDLAAHYHNLVREWADV